MTQNRTEETLSKLNRFLKPSQILIREPMKDHTSMRVGGIAELLVLPSTSHEVIETKKVLCAMGSPHYIMGNGTNLLVADSGYPGVMIKLAENFSGISVDGNRICAQAGSNIVTVSSMALKNSLSGLEFAAGIPGTTGGAVAMNAGAYGGEMKDVVTQTLCINEAAEEICLCGEEHEFGNRTSRIQREKLFALEIRMKLEKGNPDQIKEKMQALNTQRRDKQPLSYPSAGSVFKRPEGCFAGRLIEDAGLKGYCIGGAQVSEKHCGFIVNRGNATATDVIKLIEYVREKVFLRSGVMLEPEVKILGG